MKLVLVGYGNMGAALATGLIAQGHEIVAVEKVDSRRQAARGAGLALAAGLDQALPADGVVLAVKPQDFFDLARASSGGLGATPLVSIMAGVPLSLLQSETGATRAARLMPNLAAAVARSVVGLSFSDESDETLLSVSRTVAAALGTVIEVPERLLPAITGVSGSGIAYVFSFLHAMALGGTRAGLPYPQALQAAIGSVEGAAALLRETGTHPIELLSRVTSPAGTTIEGVHALESAGFSAGVMDAVTRTADRALAMEERLVEMRKSHG